MASRQRSPFGDLPPLGEVIPTSTTAVRLLEESDGSITMEVGGVPSSQLHPDPLHLDFEYMRWMMVAIEEWVEAGGSTPETLQAAHLGGAGCALPRALAARWPRARQTVVEIDRILADSVREWFALPRSPQLRIRVGDAADALREWREARFDLVVRDVFDGTETPANLIGAQAARDCRRVLRTGGVLLANCAGPAGTARIADEATTLSSVFPHVEVIAEPAVLRGKRRGNTVLLASDQPLPESIERRLRSDPVSVRLLPRRDVEKLVMSGSVLP